MNLLKPFLLILLACSGCSSDRDGVSIRIVERRTLDSIPSGSGLALYEDQFLLVADDARYVYAISPVEYRYRSYAIEAVSGIRTHRIPKPLKPDLEAALVLKDSGRSVFFAFGSGSRSPERDKLLILDPGKPDDQRMLDAQAFYGSIRRQAGIRAKDWNLEGAAFATDSIVLANRGDNSLILMGKEAFLNYVNKGTELPAIRHFQIDLPAYQKYIPRISGLCRWKGDWLLFCASIEDTPNWHTDGSVIGSAIGALNRVSGKLAWMGYLKDEKGTMLKEKIEAIELIESTGKKLTLIAIADNDAGNTKLFKLALLLP